ncbi:hypothetical protein [Dyella sp. 20L07]|uniref:hypothetical protein n=1 Tax=Dyella sp. 20L07 TaxID=3384240 RepID=UPI003D2BFB58
MRTFKWVFGVTALCVAASPLLLYAEDAHIPPAYLLDGVESPIAVYVAATRSQAENPTTDIGKGVDNATLAEMSGGTMVVQNTTLNGTVSNDSADHVISGSNIITGGAFAGETGIPTVIQNSGNNVLIQSATVLNVQFKP